MEESSSMLICDYCKNVMENPIILLNCNNQICLKHYQADSKCIFCDQISEMYVEQKRLNLMILKYNRAQDSVMKNRRKLDELKNLNENPGEFINEFFESLKERINNAKLEFIQKIVDQIEANNQDMINNIEEIRLECLKSADQCKNLTYLNELNNELFQTCTNEVDAQKIAEPQWEKIINKSNDVSSLIESMKNNVKNILLKNKSIQFENIQPIEGMSFGRLIISNIEHNHSVDSQNMTTEDKSPDFCKLNTRICEPMNRQLKMEKIDHVPVPAPALAPALAPELEQELDPQPYTESNTSKTSQEDIKPMLIGDLIQNEIINQSDNVPDNYIRILGHSNFVYCLSFDRTGKYIFTGSDDKIVKLWRASDGVLLFTFKGHTKEIIDMDVNYENTALVTGSSNIVRIWDLNYLRLIGVLSGHGAEITYVKFSPYCKGNIRWLASSGKDGCMLFWKLSSANRLLCDPIKFYEHERITSLSFSSGGCFLSCGKKDGSLSVYSFSDTNEKPEKVFVRKGHFSMIQSVEYCFNSSRFMTCSKDGHILVWDFQSGKENLINIDTSITNNHKINIKNRYSVETCKWNCDDSLIVSSHFYNSKVTPEHTIKIWNSTNGTLLHEFNEHKDNIFTLETHPTNPSLLLSGSHDGHVILWNISTGKIIISFYNEIGNDGKHGGICDVKWSPIGNMFASTDSHGHLSLYGYGNKENYSGTPDQQFFHDDYAFTVDKNNKYLIVNVNTQIETYKMPQGFLVDLKWRPLDLRYQQLIDGRHNLTQDEFNKNVALTGDGSYEIVDDPNIMINNPGPYDYFSTLDPDILNEGTRLNMFEKEKNYYNLNFVKDSNLITESEDESELKRPKRKSRATNFKDVSAENDDDDDSAFNNLDDNTDYQEESEYDDEMDEDELPGMLNLNSNYNISVPNTLINDTYPVVSNGFKRVKRESEQNFY